MTRRRTAVLVGALALFCGCRRSEPPWKSEPTLLIPPSATLLAGAKIRSTIASSAYETQRKQLESGAVADALADATACKLHPNQVDSIHLGADTNQNFVLVIRGLGVGEPDRWECLAQRQTPGALLPAFAVDRSAGKHVLLRGLSSSGATDAVGTLVDLNTVVVTSAAWQVEVERLIDTPAKPEAAPLLRERQAALGGSTAHDFWLYALSPAITEASDLPVISWVALAVDVGKGLNVAANASFASAPQAQAASEQLRERMRLFSRLKPMFGLTRDLAANLKVSVQSEVLTLAGELTADDLSDIQRALSRISQGPQKAPPLPPPSLGLAADATQTTSATPDSANHEVPAPADAATVDAGE